MKKGTVLRIAVLLSAFFSTTGYSQYSINSVSDALRKADVRSLIVPAEISTGNSGIEELQMLNANAYNNFVKEFSNPEDVSAYEENENTFVSCVVDSVRHRILYSKKGDWIYTVKYAVDAPWDVTKFIGEEFPRYKIVRTLELNVGFKTAYLVDIEYKNKFKTIRIVDDSFEVSNEGVK